MPSHLAAFAGPKHVNGACEHSPSAASPEHMGGRRVYKNRWAEIRRLFHELEGDSGESLTAIPEPLAAGGNCEPFLINDMGKSVLEELQGILSELQKNGAKLQAVQNGTTTVQAHVTKYVEQRLREHNKLLENRITQEVRKQLGVLAVSLQKKGGPIPDALPSTLLVSQCQNIETKSHRNSCSSLPGTLAELPPRNTVESEQQDDHLLMQQAMEIGIGAIEQQLKVGIGVIEQQLEAAVAEAEFAEAELAIPSLLDLSRCETKDAALLSSQASGNAAQVCTLRTCSLFYPQRRTSSEHRQQQQQQQQQQQVFKSHLGVRGASSIKKEALPAPDWMRTKHRRDGNCRQRPPGHSRWLIS